MSTCPNREAMQDFVDGELSKAQSEQIAEHIKECETCKKELAEILMLYDALRKIVDADPCPELEELKSYAERNCNEEQIVDIQKHLDNCSRCKSCIWAFQASDEEFQAWQDKEEKEYAEWARRSA